MPTHTFLCSPDEIPNNFYQLQRPGVGVIHGTVRIENGLLTQMIARQKGRKNVSHAEAVNR